MKKQVSNLIDDSIIGLGLFTSDAFIEKIDGKNIFNIVLDSKEIIDMNKITKASKIINKIMDEEKGLMRDIDELYIYSKEKGD